MTWIKIDRDENGFATEECLDKIFSNLPIVLLYKLPDGRKVYEGISETDYIDSWRGDIALALQTSTTLLLGFARGDDWRSYRRSAYYDCNGRC